MTLTSPTSAVLKAQASTTSTIAIRHRVKPKYWAYFLIAGLALPSFSLRAQTMHSANEGKARSGGYLGIGVNAAPRYQGADEFRTTAIPGFEYHWANGLFVGGTDGLIGFQTDAAPQLKLGVALGLDEGRKASDSRYLAGMGDVAARGTLNLHAKAAVNGNFSLRTGLQLGTGSSGKGGLLSLGASYGFTLTPATSMSLNLGATVANADYMKDYFGVSPAQASASGYKSYLPDSGLRDVTIALSLQHQISREWMLIGCANSTTLASTAKDSPLVRRATNQSGFVALAYSF